jgi:ring-1,2-phenylacetyl-CoA epoxidase subunit PaaC
LGTLWRYTAELFFEDEVDSELKASGIIPSMEGLKEEWTSYVNEVLNLATLTVPTNNWVQEGGRKGMHSEHLGYILSELQYMQRAYPGLEW